MEKVYVPCSLKTSAKLQQKSMFYGSVIKQQNKIVNSTLESIVSLQIPICLDIACIML